MLGARVWCNRSRARRYKQVDRQRQERWEGQESTRDKEERLGTDDVSWKRREYLSSVEEAWLLERVKAWLERKVEPWVEGRGGSVGKWAVYDTITHGFCNNNICHNSLVQVNKASTMRPRMIMRKERKRASKDHKETPLWTPSLCKELEFYDAWLWRMKRPIKNRYQEQITFPLITDFSDNLEEK